jgi:hypothetical protein
MEKKLKKYSLDEIKDEFIGKKAPLTENNMNMIYKWMS